MPCPICGTVSVPGNAICSGCGFHFGVSDDALPEGFVLNARYHIGRVLGRGGFGITYQAWDDLLKRTVALKEWFPEGARRTQTVHPPRSLGQLAFDETKAQFLTEARWLSQFEDAGIVRVWDVFQEFDTCYMVMECLIGTTLGNALLMRGNLAETEVLDIARAILKSLETVHASGLLHRDIKPDNIFLTDDGRTVLIDFGSARAFAEGQTKVLTRWITPGYAAPEQYASQAKFGPYTDLYGLGATLYHALWGFPPPAAPDRLLGEPFPDRVLKAEPSNLSRTLLSALSLRVWDRPQDAVEFLNLLNEPEKPSAARLAYPSYRSFPTSDKTEGALPPSKLGLERLAIAQTVVLNNAAFPVGGIFFFSVQQIYRQTDISFLFTSNGFAYLLCWTVFGILGWAFPSIYRATAGYFLGTLTVSLWVGSWLGLLILCVLSLVVLAVTSYIANPKHES